MDEAIASRLRELGFSQYEAQVYVALVREGAQNGNEVAKHARVPSSKVYSALDKLAAAGFVQSISRGASRLWTALPPEELVPRLRRQFNEPIDFLSDELPKVRSSEPSQPFLTLGGIEPTREAAAALIDAAEAELHVSCWPEDLEAFRDNLAAAHERGVLVYGMLYGEVETPPGSWLHHHYEDIVGQRVGGRLLALVIDDREALIARIPEGGEATAVRSRNPVMTLIVKEYLHHDSVLQRAQLQIGFDEWDRWWKADPEARAEILGRAIQADAGASG